VRPTIAFVALAVGLGLAAGCGGSGSESGSAACDESTMSEAVSAAGEEQDGTTATLNPGAFGCADDWAYALADVGVGDAEVTETFVFEFTGREWVAQDREIVCKAPGDQVPEAIYADACETD
jgi:hypothetical protein